MKLLIHNLMQCSMEKCPGPRFPLKIKLKEKLAQLQDPPEAIEDLTEGVPYATKYNKAMLQGLQTRIDYDSLVQAAQDVGLGDILPLSCSPDDWTNDNFLRALFEVMMKYEVVEADLECPGCGRIYPVSTGIPNMIQTPVEETGDEK